MEVCQKEYIGLGIVPEGHSDLKSWAGHLTTVTTEIGW